MIFRLLLFFGLLPIASIAQDHFSSAITFAGKGNDMGRAIDVDRSGNIYSAGTFQDTTDFDPSIGVLELVSNGNNDVFVCKTDKKDSLLWAFGFGGRNNDVIREIIVDDSSNVYIIGYFSDTVDFDPSSKKFEIIASGTDGYFAKYDKDGNFLWVKILDGVLYDGAIDKNGNLLISGLSSYRADLAPGKGTYLVQYKRPSTFVATYNNAGHFKSALIFEADDYSSSARPGKIALNDSGHVFIAGWFFGEIDFDPSTSNNVKVSSGNDDAFIAKYNLGNKTLEWVKTINSKYFNYALAFDLDQFGNLIIGGIFDDKIDLNPGKGTHIKSAVGTSARRCDVFVLSLSPKGYYNWGFTIGDEGRDGIEELIVDTNGYFYAIGSYNGQVDFNPLVTPLTKKSGKYSSGFVAKYSLKGEARWVSSLKGNKNVIAYDLVSDEFKNLSITGAFQDSTDFNPYDKDSFKLASKGGFDAFVLSLSGCNNTKALSFDTTCTSLKSPSGKYNWTKTGVYSDLLLTKTGCDSVITVSLVVLQNDTILSFETCDSLVWNKNTVFTKSGVYYDTLKNMANCDSIIELNLVVNNCYRKIEKVSICDSYKWSLNNATYLKSGLYYDSLVTSKLCDSVSILDLTIRNSSTSTIFQNACDSFYWSQTKKYYKQSGIYLDTISNYVGCDSVVSFNLNIKSSSSSKKVVSSCNFFYWSQNKTLYKTSGIYADTIKTAAGCDSILYLELEIKLKDSIAINISTCDSFFWSIDNSWKFNSGLYTDTFTNRFGCDSIHYLNLSLNKSNVTTQFAKSCDSFFWNVNSKYYYNSGTYYDSSKTINGCDSIRVLSIAIGKVSTALDSVVACNSYLWSVNKRTYFKSGIYIDSLKGQDGCDSILALFLEINEVDTNYTLKQGLITLLDTTKAYEWLDCNDNNKKINGETSYWFKPVTDGVYSAVIISDSCRDTLTCIKVTSTDNQQFVEQEMPVIWPNPASDYLIVGKTERNTNYIIKNSIGKTVMEGKLENSSIIRVDRLNSGIYFISLEGSKKRTVNTFVKE